MRLVAGANLLAALLLLSAGSAGHAEEPDGVPKAIDRGVAYLRGLQGSDGTWPHPWKGASALAGLTLLECGATAKDPAVQKAAAAVRQASPLLRETYSLALAILFLDRLGDPRDLPLIESMAVRLLAGQSNQGGWSYFCPAPPDEESRRLTALLKQRDELATVRELPASGKPRRTADDLPPEIREQLKGLNNALLTQAQVRDHEDDNSNTQFAVLALCVARRYGLPTDNALALVTTRFRTSQNPDGGWGYKYRGAQSGASTTSSTATMTCAGLLGLAVGHVVAAPREGQGKDAERTGQALPDPAKDLALRAALLALGSTVGRPVGRGGNRPVPVVKGGRDYYFFWSLERDAVACGLKTIGGKDWYAWGAEILVASQNPDGSWQGEFDKTDNGQAYGADTCFALLFLRRADLTPDLTAALQARLEDPGEVVLRTPGAGGQAPAGPASKLPIADGHKIESGPTPSGEGKSGSPPELDPEAARLGAELVNGPEAKRQEALEKLRKGKGGDYTQALAAAIPKLRGAQKIGARDALAERLARMTAGTLRDKLSDDDLEVRRAAALAVAMKEAKSLVPRLIELLDDPEASVAHAAHAALKTLSGQDFGPAEDATRQERAEARAAWKKWWAKQGDR